MLTTTQVGNEGRQVAELLFQPSLLPEHAEQPDIVSAVIDGVADAADSASRRLMYGNVLLCGGGSNMENLRTRFKEEFRIALPPSNDPDLCVTPEYMPNAKHMSKYASWVGASILAKILQTQSNPNTHVLTKFDYEEWGPAGVHKKM